MRTWTAQLQKEGRAPSYVYALHSRLSQLFTDAVHDGLVARNPCSRRTSPPTGKKRPYVATTEQVWALYVAFAPGVRPAIVMGAHVALRLAECASLWVTDVDLKAGVIHPAVLWPEKELKRDKSRTVIPIPHEMAQISAEAARTGNGRTFLDDEWGNPGSPWPIQRAMRDARGTLDLPDDFRFHDLPRQFASLLIASELDVKVVQARLRHASAKTTLGTYVRLWLGRDDTSRAAIAASYRERDE